jgi:hypothetical protein
VRAHHPLLRESGLAGYFAGSYPDDRASSLDRLSVDAGLSKALLRHPAPYLELGQRLSTSPVRRMDGVECNGFGSERRLANTCGFDGGHV